MGERNSLNPSKVDLLHYWQTLADNGFDPAQAYWRTLQRALGESVTEDAPEIEWRTVTVNGVNGEIVSPLFFSNQSLKCSFVISLKILFRS